MVGVRRDLQVYLAQPLPKLGHPEQGTQGRGQAASEGHQGEDPTASLGSLYQCSVAPEVLAGVQREPPVLQFNAICVLRKLVA